NERLQQTLKALRTNYHSLEVSMREKSSRIDHLQSMLESERTRHEEDIVCLRMQQLKADQPEGRAGGGGEEGGIEACRAALAESEAQRALLVSEAAVLGEVKTADAERLEALENELRACREKAREVERNYGASMLLKAEQEALLVTLRRDLMSALAAKEEGQRRVRELEQYRVKAEGQLVRLMEHKERLELTEAKLEESGALVKRLQTQLQAVETNYATKTALLAASEAASEELRSQLSEKEEGLAEVVERMSVLQAQMADAEAKLLQQSTAYAGLEESKQRELADLQASHVAELQREIDQRERSSAEAQAEYAKKSSAARMLLSEREEELRLLRAKVDELKEEIASGNPTERKIFELAKSQADRDAAIELNRDTRELTFQQVQNALAVKDLELARLQQTHTQLANEAADLRRVAKREGVNMDYLKNVVLQYMTFPHASAERNALVPVLSLLLQFSAAELSQVDAASKASIWAPGRQAKEVKLHPIAKEEGAALDQTTARQLHRDLDRSSGRPPHGSGGSQIEPTVYEKPLQYNEV
ncbi:Gcc1, partial [Symbiodinium microadriaticum]